MKNKTSIFIALGIVCFIGFSMRKPFDDEVVKESSVVQAYTKKEESRPEQFYVVNNYYANETIRILQDKGWKVKGVKPLSSPNDFGCYDVLITYE